MGNIPDYGEAKKAHIQAPLDSATPEQIAAIRESKSVPFHLQCSACHYLPKTKRDFDRHWFEEHT
jgi:hypothetical protein